MARFNPIATAATPERALLVGVEWPHGTWPVERSLDELERLVETAGARPVSRMIQRRARPVPRTLIGSGKVEEVASAVRRLDIDVVVFDDDLTPSQQGNLEKAVGGSVKIIDRTAIILDIFGMRAQTREGRIQVQLAQLQYLLPRLRGMWSHLIKEQTRGGIGSRFGQGESQLEVDRRLIRDRISRLRAQLRDVERSRNVQSMARVESCAFRIALAGYTNAGKSTLMNRLTQADVLAADKLFATLDPTTRTFRLPGGRASTLTDTVGFIQKLPHGLVDAFKSTLSEVRDADIILSVVDVFDEDHPRHMAAVDAVLDEIGAGGRPRITVLNKVDRIDASARADLARLYPTAEPVSASTGAGIEALRARLSREASSQDRPVSMRIPYRAAALIALVREQGQIRREEYQGDVVSITADVSPRIIARLAPYLDEPSDHGLADGTPSADQDPQQR